MVHSGHYPAWGGGGEAWCSPTSTGDGARLLRHLPGAHRHHGRPRRRRRRPHRQDGLRPRLRGTGNWAFNTAYAATLVGGDSYVTRMRDLREAEDYIVAGVPLVVSIAFGRNQLTGAPISASNGHLLVVVGFEADGDVVVNDPGRRDQRRGAPRLRPRPVRADLDRRLRRDGVRHPQRYSRTPAALGDRVTGRQPALNSTACQPGRAVRVRRALRRWSGSRRPCRSRAPGPRGRPRGTSIVTAHCTQVSTDGTPPSSARLHVAAVDLHLDAVDAGVLVPGHAAERDRAGRDVVAGARDVDPRGDLDRPLGGPALASSSSRSTRRTCSPRGRRPTWWPRRSRRGPGTIVRTGKPCSMGSGRPFIATASIASRSSVRASSGVAQVQPSCGGLQHAVGVVG